MSADRKCDLAPECCAECQQRQHSCPVGTRKLHNERNLTEVCVYMYVCAQIRRILVYMCLCMSSNLRAYDEMAVMKMAATEMADYLCI